MPRSCPGRIARALGPPPPRGAEGYYFKYNEWPTIGEYLKKTYTDDNNNPYPDDYLIEFKLVSSERDNLLSRLSSINIDSSHLMPSYDNVGQQIDKDIAGG